MPSDQIFDPIQRITQQVADCFSASGYAFVEDDKLEALALHSARRRSSAPFQRIDVEQVEDFEL
jgi:hypothetical protein